MSAPQISPAERSYILDGLAHPTNPTRLDGRQLDTFRPIDISYGDAPQSYGSARVVLGGKGGTEVVAGIKLEVVDTEEEGSSSWRTVVEVDVTPQAYPYLNSNERNALSSQYTNLIADHFVPYLPALPILPPHKYFQPQLHLSLLSASTASIPTVLFLATRAAFSSLLIPSTKSVGWESLASNPSGTSTSLAGLPTLDSSEGTGMAGSDIGLSGAVKALKGKGKGKGKGGLEKKGNRAQGGSGKGDDWDLDNGVSGGNQGSLMEVDVRNGLPVCVTLNLIPGSQNIYLDASASEELASTHRIHLIFCKPTLQNSSPNDDLKVCGIRMDGGEGIEGNRLRSLLKEGERVAKLLMKDLNANMVVNA